MLRHHLHAVGDQRRIAAEAVDDEARDHGVVGRVDDGLRADEAGNHAAAVDVAHQHDGHVGGAGEAHVGDVGGAQVHFRRRARALDQHEVGLARKVLETLEHGAQQPGLHGLIFARLRGADDPALDHDLRADVALGLQEDRIHVHAGCHAGGTGLQRLRPADLAAVGGHGGVVGHVLRLERPDAKPAPGEGTRQRGDQQRLADIRARALDHEGPGSLGGGHQNSMPSCAFTPAAKWCFTRVISVTRSAASVISALALRPVTTTCRSGRRPVRAATTSVVSRWS